jgi:hypothetical protein
MGRLAAAAAARTQQSAAASLLKLRQGRGRRMSLFDSTCIGRAVMPADIAAASTAVNAVDVSGVAAAGTGGGPVGATSRSTTSLLASSNSLSSYASKLARDRLIGLTELDQQRLASLAVEEVLDGVVLVRGRRAKSPCQ